MTEDIDFDTPVKPAAKGAKKTAEPECTDCLPHQFADVPHDPMTGKVDELWTLKNPVRFAAYKAMRKEHFGKEKTTEVN